MRDTLAPPLLLLILLLGCAPEPVVEDRQVDLYLEESAAAVLEQTRLAGALAAHRLFVRSLAAGSSTAISELALPSFAWIVFGPRDSVGRLPLHTYSRDDIVNGDSPEGLAFLARQEQTTMLSDTSVRISGQLHDLRVEMEAMWHLVDERWRIAQLKTTLHD